MAVLSSLSRRAFFSNLLLGIPVIAFGQEAVMEGGKAIVCDSGTATCPNGHKTCRKIDTPIVVGNDNRDYPDIKGQLFDYHMLRCDVCHVLFTRE
jgi:hypothetical protein